MGDRDQYGDRDGAGGGQAHRGEDRDADHGQSGQGDDDGEAGEDNRGPGGAHRTSGRLSTVAALQQFVPETRDDEQRVVDADGEAEHEGQDQAVGVDVGEAGQGGDAGDADADPDDGGEQRQSGRDQRSEGDDEHEGGDQNSDAFRCPGGLTGAQRVTAGFDGESGSPAGLERLLQRGPVGVGQLGALDLVAHLGDRVAAVGRDGRGLERVCDGADLWCRRHRRDHLSDGGSVGGLRQRRTRRGDEDDPGGGASDIGLREPVGQLVDGLLCLGARHGERVGHLAGQRAGAHSGQDQDERPDAGDLPAMAVTEPAQPVQQRCHDMHSFGRTRRPMRRH